MLFILSLLSLASLKLYQVNITNMRTVAEGYLAHSLAEMAYQHEYLKIEDQVESEMEAKYEDRLANEEKRIEKAIQDKEEAAQLKEREEQEASRKRDKEKQNQERDAYEPIPSLNKEYFAAIIDQGQLDTSDPDQVYLIQVNTDSDSEEILVNGPGLEEMLEHEDEETEIILVNVYPNYDQAQEDLSARKAAEDTSREEADLEEEKAEELSDEEEKAQEETRQKRMNEAKEKELKQVKAKLKDKQEKETSQKVKDQRANLKLNKRFYFNLGQVDYYTQNDQQLCRVTIYASDTVYDLKF
ncbi:hypothetical protein CYJ29_03910 [Aerococcus loyolae]|uniref:Uncharacterized protein n=2 Tax=Aerococcus TaxID=1375 RepID=A0A178HK01_9LACT|nr:hypothetical protein [Aerococcus urinae]OAM72286.1 hypothetical protein A1D21_00440 [Aerococcus loyolae]OFL14996.1 hypothetical protein HMPREF2784_02620 [Aerococcus loyolae]PKY86680.1 hypothetical protein CYJ30_03635 [Aerococcus loyolae]PKZ03833.1 hypothetical protein CYJ29_03910 [Aerococcus loyolae]RAV77640.1 hypothetical protein DBT54_08405 [Aerococcus loyolae]